MRQAPIAAAALTLGVGVFATSVGAASASSSPARIASCTASEVAVSFNVVRGSQGAGQTSYALRVKNVSAATCRTGGLPQLVLRGGRGAKLPTKVEVACGNCAAIVINLRPGLSAWSTARFSPDVPGPGETGRQCEPTAYHVVVTTPGSTRGVEGAIHPPTPVCSHGRILLTYLGTSKPAA
ncbi:MAG: DUF4232 domain-containing protein [Acidimicrobiales bacterium]